MEGISIWRKGVLLWQFPTDGEDVHFTLLALATVTLILDWAVSDGCSKSQAAMIDASGNGVLEVR